MKKKIGKIDKRLIELHRSTYGLFIKHFKCALFKTLFALRVIFDYYLSTLNEHDFVLKCLLIKVPAMSNRIQVVVS